MRKVFVIIGMPFLSTAIGFVIGIVPGLFLGWIGWWEGGAVIIPLIWAFGYISQRRRNYGFVDWITFAVGIFGGLGIGIAVFFFGNMIAK